MPGRIKVGQYLFLRHGGKVVFVGRFIAVLPALAAFLAGANRMTWPRFLLFNAAGGIVWSAAYGFGAYFLGKAIHRLIGPVGITLGILAVLIIVVGTIFIRRIGPGSFRAFADRQRDSYLATRAGQELDEAAVRAHDFPHDREAKSMARRFRAGFAKPLKYRLS